MLTLCYVVLCCVLVGVVTICISNVKVGNNYDVWDQYQAVGYEANMVNFENALNAQASFNDSLRMVSKK